MKLRLVVASGVHEGKAIPVTSPQFIIGREPQCQLRPASPAISKRHCAILVRGGQVFVRDFGSTNGTFVNDQLVQGETQVRDGDLLKVGPLEFRVGMEVAAPAPKPPAPAPARQPAGAVAAPAQPAVATVAPAADADADTNVDIAAAATPTGGPPSDRIAAELLLDDDGPAGATESTTLGNESVPEGSTIMEVPATGPDGKPIPQKKATAGTTGNTSAAAAEILRRYQRRPRA
jgi:pSer/pThr/pTyr-binding forkhead associated (FHA) protein